MSFFPTQSEIEAAYAEGADMAESGQADLATQLSPLGLDPVEDARSAGYNDELTK